MLFCSQSNQFLRNKQVITTQQSLPLLLRQDGMHRRGQRNRDETLTGSKIKTESIQLCTDKDRKSHRKKRLDVAVRLAKSQKVT